LIGSKRAIGREGGFGEAGFVRRALARFDESLGKQLIDRRLQTRRLAYQLSDPAPLLADRRRPAPRSEPDLNLPLQQMSEHDEPAFDLALVAAADALELLGDVLDVEAREFAVAQQARLLHRPGVEVFVVTRGVARDRRSFAPGTNSLGLSRRPKL
jgi:hypothetical protein